MIWFDLIVAILVIVTLIKGFISGLIMQIASLAGIILGAIFAGQLSGYIAPFMITYIGGSPHVIGVVAYIVSFLLIVVALLIAGKLVQSLIKAMEMNTANRVAGSLFCCTKWIIIFSILVNLVAELDQDKYLIKGDVRSDAYTYNIVCKVSQIVVPYLRFDWINNPE